MRSRRLDPINRTSSDRFCYRSTLPCRLLQIHDGVRVTSAASYLAQAFNRTNLDILVDTRVTKLLPVGTSKTPDMRTVQFAQSANGQRGCRVRWELWLTGRQGRSTHSRRRRKLSFLPDLSRLLTFVRRSCSLSAMCHAD